MNKEQPVTLTLQELDNTIFTHLTAAMAVQFPNEHRTALKVAMRVADGAMAEFEALAKRQSKSGAARVAAEARWSGAVSVPPAANGSPTVPANLADNPVAQANAASWPAVPKKRNRRTKAQIAADHAAQVAALTNLGAPVSATVPVPVPPYTPPAPAPFTPAEQQAASEFGAAPPAPVTPTPASVDAAVAAASGSPVSNVPPPPPLQIPTFGQP